MKRRVIVILAVVLALTIQLGIGWQWVRSRSVTIELDRWENNSFLVIQQLQGLLSDLKDAETGEHGFLITGDANYLEPYKGALGLVDQKLASLRTLTRNNPLQQRRLAAIEPIIHGKLAELKEAVELRTNTGFDSARQLVMTGRGKALMDQVRQQVAQAQTEEMQLLKEHTLAKAAYARKTFLTGIIGGIFSCILVASAVLFLDRENLRRIAVERELLGHRDHLENLVNERTRKLRDSEERLQFALETCHIGAWDLDLVDHTVYRSLEHDRIFGYTQLLPEWTLETFLQHALPEYRAALEAMLRQAVAIQDGWNFECRIRRADGKVRWIWAAGRQYSDADGRGRMGGVVQDITERKEAEEQLRESERRFRTAFENGAIAMTLTSLDGKLLKVNSVFCQMLGYSEPELVGHSFGEVTHPDDLAANLCGVQRLRKREVRSFRMEKRYLRKDGTVIWGDLGTAAVCDVQGVPLYFVTHVQDITERKGAEEALRESEQQFRTLADSIPNMAWWANSDGYISWYNRRWYDYTGTTPEQMEGWGWQSVHAPEMLPKVLEQWRASIGTGEPFEMEFPLRGADGQFRWFLTRVVPLRDGAAKVVRWFGTNTDVSEARAAREVLARSKEELERLVAERTAQLAEANANLQHFAYTAAHDLRAPLRGIISFAQLVMTRYGERLDGMGRSVVERVVESANQMGQLLNDLLEYSKITQRDLHLERVKLEGTVREALALLEEEIRATQATVNVATPLPEAIGHPATVLMLVCNLISNGLKFMPAGVKPQLQIWTEPVRGWGGAGQTEGSAAGEGHGAFVRLWVQDNGIGIAPQDQGKVFGAFQRLHGKGTYPGTGLGLAIVRRGAERMGGRVGLESELGKGSRFWVELQAAGAAS